MRPHHSKFGETPKTADRAPEALKTSTFIEIERRGKGGWDEVLATEAHLVAPGEEWKLSLIHI